MGYVLVKANGQQQQQQTQGAPMFNAGFTSPQISMGGPGQAFVQLDATYQPWLKDRKDQNKTVSFPKDEHFLNPFTNRMEPSPLAGTTEVNPNFGSSIDSKAARVGMGAAQLAGLGLGAYTALMNFADDSTQDPVSSALGALGAGYITYAQLAPVANYLAGRGDARLANALEDYKQNRSSQEWLNQNITGIRRPQPSPAPSTSAPIGSLTAIPTPKPPVQEAAPAPSTPPAPEKVGTLTAIPKPEPEPIQPDLGTTDSDISLGESEEEKKKIAVKRRKEAMKQKLEEKEEEEDGGTRQSSLSEGWGSGYGG